MLLETMMANDPKRPPGALELTMHAAQPLRVTDTDTHDSIKASSAQPLTHHAFVSEAAVATQLLLFDSSTEESFVSAIEISQKG